LISLLTECTAVEDEYFSLKIELIAFHYLLGFPRILIAFAYFVVGLWPGGDRKYRKQFKTKHPK
jgi:hypothetical protein